MVTFLLGLGILIGGYFLYGGLMDRSIQPDPARPTPAILRPDGVDFVPISTWRVYLIQLLNIAGLGPVFGPIMGALWGPQVFLWVILGAVFGGAAHDYLSGVMSIRNNGAGLPDLIGRYLGRVTQHSAVLFILLLMVLVGTVFVKGPAALIVTILPAETVSIWFGTAGGALETAQFQGLSLWMWIVMAIIFSYYVFATLLPIDKIIGRLYPFFALALLTMVVCLGGALLIGRIETPPFTLANLHPRSVPAWPIIFITVSCGAISGFHATQSPLMARCLKTERHMRFVFYGAMIGEAVIALVWATVSQGYYGGTAGLAAALGPRLNNATVVVHTICNDVMGTFGGVLAIMGVVVLPITSGDTAFRVARLILADYFKLPQTKIRNRYLLALPLFSISLVLNVVPFGIIWRYFGWANQTLAAITLWAGAAFLSRRGKAWWLAALPATFMTVMTVTYVLVESKENGCVGLDYTLGTVLGLIAGATALVVFLWLRTKLPPDESEPALQPRPTEAERASDGIAS
ncbi:MAG: carbon starvation protein A [Deltaproteobacteria bacterium]|nr:carbon starvation protein A [Deltaproteobacteria bacterium]